MKKILITICILLCSAPIFAAQITLTSGEVLTGKIVDEGDDYIKFDQGFGRATYFKDDIQSIMDEAGSLTSEKTMQFSGKKLDPATAGDMVDTVSFHYKSSFEERDVKGIVIERTDDYIRMFEYYEGELIDMTYFLDAISDLTEGQDAPPEDFESYTVDNDLRREYYWVFGRWEIDFEKTMSDVEMNHFVSEYKDQIEPQLEGQVEEGFSIEVTEDMIYFNYGEDAYSVTYKKDSFNGLQFVVQYQREEVTHVLTFNINGEDELVVQSTEMFVDEVYPTNLQYYHWKKVQ